MVTFLKQVVNFLLLSTLLLSFIILVPPYFINKKANFKLDKNDEMIVVGHSHPECAYNDSLIPSLKNLANSGESYFYTLQKLKKIVPANPQIKTIH